MTNYLEQINSPEDIKRLNCQQLTDLADEIRSYLLKVISQNGGHLSSNLGTVELTLAIHKIYDTSKDRLVWDVGHQAYVHKIITGRREAFTTLRQANGLAGFPKRAESIHDAFDTGHSSTSIAAALGFAKARDLKRADHQVIAVIGDGSMTGGEAYEALNLAADLNTNILVILNDNHMSIARNIGSMAGYLNRLRASGIYNKSKKGIRHFLGKIPCIGKGLVHGIERFKESVKYLIVPGVVFNELGFNYYGPVDGHDIRSLVELLIKVKDLNGPILLHVITRKGKGYLPAQQDAATFHGVGPFEVESGKTITNNSTIPTFTKAFSDTMLEMAAADARVMGITAAMADGTGLEQFAKQYPSRFVDVGIAEQTAVTIGTALALDGMRPVVAIYSSFLQRAFDQLIQDTAIQNAPVIFAIDRAGLVGEDGPTHHGAFDLTYLRAIPQMAIMVPRDENCLRDMFWTALKDQAGPVAIRYPRGKAQGVALAETVTTMGWGTGEVLRSGRDAVILAVGPVIYQALQAAEQLAAHGYEIGIVDARFVKPLPETLILDLCRQYPLLVTIEENCLSGGFGSAVLELVARQQSPQPKIVTWGLPDEFITQGNQAYLRAELKLDAAGIFSSIKELLEKDRQQDD